VGLWDDFFAELDRATTGEGLSALADLKQKLQYGEGPANFDANGSLEQSYPPAYPTLVSLFSETRNLPSALAWAIMREESHFRPSVVSPANAIGLMQIIPPTGYEIAQNLGRNQFTQEDLYRPAVNIEFGVQYLAMNLNRFNGNFVGTIASYNAGPEAVERWTKARPNREWDEFVEEIPYDETNNYVKKVLKSYYLYSLLYR
jgi:soluble lytic murein transglycosylase